VGLAMSWCASRCGVNSSTCCRRQPILHATASLKFNTTWLLLLLLLLLLCLAQGPLATCCPGAGRWND
jgi:hypothetical protein